MQHLKRRQVSLQQDRPTQTSGYEEAAGQGPVAGINAALESPSKPELFSNEKMPILGVMIDDLCHEKEPWPYRLLTSRAEYRLILRHD